MFIVCSNNCSCSAKTKNNSQNKNNTITYNVKTRFAHFVIVDNENENNPKRIEYTYYLITNKDGTKYGIADNNGKLIIPCEYDCIYMGNNFIIVEKDGKAGAFSKFGKTVLPIEFDKINYSFKNLIVIVSDKQSLYSQDGQKQLSEDYDKITAIVKGKFLLKKANKYFLYNEEKKEVTHLPYDEVSRYLNYLLIEKDGKKGLYSYANETVILPVKYDNIQGCSNGTFIVSIGGTKGLFDINSSNFLLPIIYKDIKINHNLYLLSLKKKNNKFDLGYIYTKDKQTSALVFEIDADEISDNKLWHPTYKKKYKLYIPAKKDGKYGIITFLREKRISVLALPYEYDEIASIGNFYKIKKNEKFAIYDILNQKFRSDFLFDDCERLGLSRYFKVENDGKYAVLDLNNDKISDFEYEDIRLSSKFHHQYIQVKKNGKWKYINPSKIVKQGFANGLYYTGLLVASPVLVPTAAVFCILIYSGVHESPPKYPKKIKVYSE